MRLHNGLFTIIMACLCGKKAVKANCTTCPATYQCSAYDWNIHNQTKATLCLS